MSFRELAFPEGNLGRAFANVKEMFGRDLEGVGHKVLEKVMNVAIDQEYRVFIGAGRYRRVKGRRDWRNGKRRRRLLTALGEVELEIPRCRQESFQPSWLERYRRIEHRVREGIKGMFIGGVSTRKVGDVLQVLCGTRVSASTASNLAKELDEQVRSFAQRPLEDSFVFLFLDGINVTIGHEIGAKRYCLLVAYGIRADGSRELLAFQKAGSESAAAWQAFLENLKMRGLRGENLKLIVIDGGKGLWKAFQKVYPLVAAQLCWVHKLRNIASHCPKIHRKSCMEAAKKIMYAQSAACAASRFRRWRQRWQNKAPNAVACLERDFDKLLAVFGFPQALRPLIRSTNVIERCFREIQRRVRPMGYFRNSASCQRIIYALFAYCNKQWEKKRFRLNAVKNYIAKAA
jgi:transposase-like protein